MPAKFLKSDFVRERAKLVSEDKLIDVSSNSASEVNHISKISHLVTGCGSKIFKSY